MDRPVRDRHPSGPHTRRQAMGAEIVPTAFRFASAHRARAAQPWSSKPTGTAKARG